MTELVDKSTLQKRDSRPIRDHSTFDNSYRLAGTYRFGEYAPTMVLPVVPSDNHGVRSNHKVRSYTLKQPLLNDIKLKEDTFLVPYSALLFRNYEKYITAPNIGDDVDANEVGLSVVGFSSKVFSLITGYRTCLLSGFEDDGVSELLITAFFKYLVLIDIYYSSGSMFNAFGMPLTSNSKKADEIIDRFMSLIEDIGTASFNLRVKIGDKYFEIGRPSVNAGDSSISLREFWNRIHDTADWSVSSYTDLDNFWVEYFTDSQTDFAVNYFVVPDYSAPYDLSPFGAYQISCAHFYSNDKVDYIYSAQLWRESLRTLINEIGDLNSSSFDSETFQFNGITCQYDEFSAKAFNFVFDSIGEVFDLDAFSYFLEYSLYLFAFRRSLRFVDYTTGSRTRPLAPGDASISVSEGTIDVVESIQKKWYIRLWSQISRVGHKISEQMKGLFPDVEPSIDWHDPIWIHGTSGGSIFAEEIDNTSDNQFDPKTPIAVTSVINGFINDKSINLSINDRYGVVISITHFDIPRFYYKGVDRLFFNVDRYDRFNPFLQFMGDQKVYLKELDADASFASVFGYQGRYEEQKQRLSRAFGGFINNTLPGMVFLADEARDRFSQESQSPSYIRSYQSELDKFFIALSGWSLGTYYHFIMVTDNEIESSRPMAYNPQIQ